MQRRSLVILVPVCGLLSAACVDLPAAIDAPAASEERVVTKVDCGPYIGVTRQSLESLEAYRSGATGNAQFYGLGRPAHDSEIIAWDVDVLRNGHGLPNGSGSVAEGALIYAEECSICHGAKGEGVPPYLALSAKESTARTIGSYWPYATTVFDYVRRTMPFDTPGSLTNDEVYALTAYLLHMNDIIPLDGVMDATSLPQIEMPNSNSFIVDDRESSNEVH